MRAGVFLGGFCTLLTLQRQTLRPAVSGVLPPSPNRFRQWLGAGSAMMLQVQSCKDIHGNISCRASIPSHSYGPCSEHGVNQQTFLERALLTKVRSSEDPRFVGWNRFPPLFFKASPISPYTDDRKFSPEP